MSLWWIALIVVGVLGIVILSFWAGMELVVRTIAAMVYVIIRGKRN